MNKKVWFRAASSFEEAEAFDRNYYLSMSQEERLDTVQFLREQATKLGKGKNFEGRKRLRRVIRIIQQT